MSFPSLTYHGPSWSPFKCPGVCPGRRRARLPAELPGGARRRGGGGAAGAVSGGGGVGEWCGDAWDEVRDANKSGYMLSLDSMCMYVLCLYIYTHTPYTYLITRIICEGKDHWSFIRNPGLYPRHPCRIQTKDFGALPTLCLSRLIEWDDLPVETWDLNLVGPSSS